MNPDFTGNSQQSKNKRKISSNGFTRHSKIEMRKACELFFMISRIHISKEENVQSQNPEELKPMASGKKESFFPCLLIQKAIHFPGKYLKTTLPTSQHSRKILIYGKSNSTFPK